ncbi:MAG TPA: amino acid adenylation domain-containing protein [Longimicrobium sp.]|nr:amino acid adenylation domain-containing protein [Longimicrobium sp.]
MDGEPAQHVAPVEGTGFHLREHDLEGLPATDAEPALARLAADEAGAPFDLAEGPLVRGRLVRLGARDHVLLVTVHHIVFDGWSMDVFVQELGALYGAFRRGAADPLPPLPVQYADYAAWQRRLVSGELLRTQAEYWTQALAGAPELLELPTDHVRPLQQEHGGDRVELELDEALTAQLRALGARHGATLFMTVLAGWAATLTRLSGQAEVVIGAPTANRGRREIEGVIGFFVNTLALRVDLSGAPTAAELLERVRARTLDAQQNQDIPFEQVVERVQPVRSLAHSPLFQVMLIWQSTPPVRPELPGLALQSLGGEPEGTAKFDLTLSLAEADGRITGDLTYATALFERGTVERHLGYLRRVLEGMVAGERRAVDRLPLLSEGERRRVMAEWNATTAAFPGESCIHHLFEAQVERTPDAVAVVHRGETLTYAELNARANRLAHHLRARGVGPDARVAVCVERGLEMILGLLAVLKAGGAYVPLDPAYPVERLRYMLENSDPAALLAQASLAEGLAPAGLPVVDLSAPAPEWAAGPAANPDRDRVGLAPGHLAYVIYTSGSTGQPKGVMVGHGGVVNLLWSMHDVVGMAPGDRFLSVTTIAFDIAALELFLPLACGATTVILDRSEAADPVLLAAAISREEATVLQATPATWRMLVEGGWQGREGLRALCGGEALGSVLAAQVRERVGALWNVYGPTETTIWSSAAAVAGEADPAGRAHAPIGRPLANTQFHVLDGRLEPVPVGVTGELYIGGAGVTRGYRRRPGQTADRFVPDPFGAEPGARLYRTGDLGRWLPGGTLEFMGRNDAQVKVRGFRVELGEIEARLAQHPEVREAVAVVRADGPGGDRLVAYYTGGDAGAEALRAHLSERLPEYMVPAAYVRLPALPLTANGKLDRRALPAPGGDAYARHGYEAPAGGTETALAEIWSELLGVDRVGAHDSFFALGGHSLLAMRVISRVRQVFAVELPPQTLFVAPTVAGMAGRVDALRRAGLPVPRPVVPVARTGPAPLSFAQERFWFLDRLQPGSAFYNIPIPLRLSGELEAGALERALGEIVRRHEALRTVFVEREGTPLQDVAPFRGFRLPVKDLSRLPANAREAEVQREALADAARPFDLAAGPLFRASLLRLDAGEHVLLVCMHHIVGDGWSLGVLFREMSALYEAYRAGCTSPLPELPVQYADYALWQRESLRDEALEREMAYWREQLAGAPALLELPTDHPRPAVLSYRGKSEAMELPAELLARLRAVGRREGATLFMVLLGAWQVLLAKYAGTADVVVGSPIAGRTRREVEELIGLFVNTLVLRTDLSGDPTLGEVLRRVRETALGAYAHQDLPFERLVAELQPERSLSHSPLFQVLFSLGSAGGTGADIPGMRIERVATEVQTTPFDLHLAFFEEPGGLRAVLRYGTDLFERGTIVRMLGHLRQVLEQVAGDAPPRFSQLQVMGAAERRQIVDGWNDTAADYPADRCSHELFEAQAERTPGAVAVVAGETELTYGELNARANRLAHRLREHGVGPDVRVGICAQRGVEMVTGLLAILKAGGAYVPLDPGYPADRLRFMLADSSPRVLLTQGVSGELFAGSEVTVIDLDAQAHSWASHSPANPARAGLVPDHLCYVIYTSGSTGRPKGVAMPHRPLVNLVAWQEPDGQRPRAAATLQFASFGFDVSFQETFTTWSTGGRLVIAGEEARHDPSALLDLVERHGVERLSLPYAMLQLVAEHAVTAGRAPASLREVQTAGEALRITEPIRRWFSALDVPLHNQYGPSETHVVTAFTLEGSAEAWPPLPSIGTPITNARVYALDGHLAPVPQGVQGELLLGGVCLARGYLDRPALTAERFIPDPFAPEPGARMYRTGDRVRWLDDGALDFLGRVDHQVKIRGFRIEPGEVEAALRRYPGITECAVVAREESPGDWRLVGYVAGEVEIQGLREHLRAGLPEHMVPSAIVCLPSLPVTRNGKLDRAALPAPEYEPAGGAYEAPRTRVEEVLAGIWAEVLRLERVGVRDNFFELGGHSLLATRVVARIREVLRSDLSVRAIFESPTVEGLAQFVADEPSIDLTGRTDLAGEQPESSGSNPYRLLSVLEDLSDDELDRLLSNEP